MRNVTRRDFLATTSALTAGLLVPSRSMAQEPGDRPPKPEGVEVLNPHGRVPVGLIIDDSTCLVNLAHFCIPQFAEVFPDRYTQPWKTLPREIPDAFVRKFGEWCHEHGVKGKYSVIPYPACVGWLDRDLPGWSKAELREPGSRPHAHGPRLGSASGIDDSYVGDQHENRTSVRGAERAVHGELGLERRQIGR